MWNRSRLSPILAAAAALLLAGTAQAATPSEGNPPPSPVINVNTASAGQLGFLPGIGPSKADRIVTYRTKRPFKAVVELARVKGIGLKTVRKLKPWLRVSGPTTLAGPVRAPKAASPRRSESGHSSGH